MREVIDYMFCALCMVCRVQVCVLHCLPGQYC